MTEDERALLLATAEALAHLLDEGATDLDKDHKDRLMALIAKVASPTGKNPL